MFLSHLLFVWLTVVFFISGLLINLVQFCVLPLYWVHQKLYRILISKLCYCLYSDFTFLAEWWGTTNLTVYAEDDVLKQLQHEKIIAILNHYSDVDWLIGWVFAERIGILGSIKVAMKHGIQYVPTLGWAWWFAEFTFLKRNWQTDKDHLMKTMKGLKNHKIPYAMTLFCEGTRRTEDKLKASQEYAIQNNMKPLKHHLVPRSKGFSMMIHELCHEVPAVYDLEFAFPNPEKCTIVNLINRGKVDVHLHIRRIPMSDIPTSSIEETSAYCQLLYQQKDELYEHFVKHGEFPGKKVALERGIWNFVTLSCHNVIVFVVLLTLLKHCVYLFGPVYTTSFLVLLGISVFALVKMLLRVTQTHKGSSFGLKHEKKEK